MTAPDTRAVTLVDIPLVWRLSEQGTMLNSELSLTRDARGPNSVLLSRILFTRGVYTLVARSNRQQVVGQFRYRPDDFNAHIVYLASTVTEDRENTVWLHILDAMVREAGKHGAHSLVAEVETSSHLFETLRTARFATYARQMIWRHSPMTFAPDDVPNLRLVEENTNDQIGIMALMCHTIPTMLQTVTVPHADMQGWVHRHEGHIEAYIALSEGKNGVYIIPYMRPDAKSDAVEILKAAIYQTAQTAKAPIYICVRSYQTWLDTALATLQFEAWVEQAIMVKHIAAGIRQTNFAPIKASVNGDLVQRGTTPAWMYHFGDEDD